MWVSIDQECINILAHCYAMKNIPSWIFANEWASYPRDNTLIDNTLQVHSLQLSSCRLLSCNHLYLQYICLHQFYKLNILFQGWDDKGWYRTDIENILITLYACTITYLILTIYLPPSILQAAAPGGHLIPGMGLNGWHRLM